MSAVLRITADPADIRRAFGVLVDEAQKANRQLAGIETQRKRTYTRTLTEEQREAIRAANQKVRNEERAAKAKERLEKDTQQKIMRINAALATYQEKKAKERTRAEERESKKRQKIEADEAKEAQRIAEGKRRAKEAQLREETRAAERAARNEFAHHQRMVRQMDQLQRRGQASRQRLIREQTAFFGRAGQVAGSAVGSGFQVASSVHSEIQDARQRRAAQETDLNTILVQRGSTAVENASSRARIIDYARTNHLDLGATIDALREAQGRHNALGGGNETERRAALEQTLRDVSFAGLIDPNNMSGLVTFSAMLRQQHVSDDVRSQMLRSVAGQSFSGSVEAESALKSGLPGMLRAVSSLTANASPADRERITQEVITDFYAQLQTVAATGGRIGVTANRVSTLRNALNNQNTQNDLGAALNARTMTADQRTEFRRAFTQDQSGKWRMNQEVANSPSQAAALFGHLFNNDATAVSNFLGVRGGNVHTAKQMLTKPATDLLTSYFAMGDDGQGHAVRQYDAVANMRRQTITQAQEDEIKATRASEDRNNLIDNENSRAQALTDNTNALNQLSSSWTKWASEHPVEATVGTTAATSLVPKLVQGIVTAAGSAVVTKGLAVAAPAAIPLGFAARNINAGSDERRQRDAHLIQMLEHHQRTGSLPSGRTETNAIEDALRPIGRWIAEAFNANPPSVRLNPQDAAILSAQHANADRPPETRR